jgi:hypothetical protein
VPRLKTGSKAGCNAIVRSRAPGEPFNVGLVDYRHAAAVDPRQRVEPEPTEAKAPGVLP